MSLDKVVDSTALDAGMALVADAIRAKAGTTDQLAWPDGFMAAVEGIQTGGGATDITDSIVSVAFSATNADNARIGLYGIIPEDAKIAIFHFQGDLSNASNNQCLFAAFPKMYSGYEMLYCRWRNGSYDLQSGSSSVYDLVVNVGDTYRMLAIK